MRIPFYLHARNGHAIGQNYHAVERQKHARHAGSFNGSTRNTAYPGGKQTHQLKAAGYHQVAYHQLSVQTLWSELEWGFHLSFVFWCHFTEWNIFHHLAFPTYILLEKIGKTSDRKKCLHTRTGVGSDSVTHNFTQIQQKMFEFELFFG